MRTFQMHLLEADKVFFEGECESLVVPTTVGQYGILAGHSNMISAVVPGVLSYRAPGKEWRTAAVSEGMVKVEGNDILVLVDSAEYPEEIDAKRAQRAADEAKEAILQKRSVREYRTAQANLARAINRLRVKKNARSGGKNHTEFPNMQKAFRAFGALFAYFTQRVCFFHELSKFRKNCGTKRRNVL